MENFPARMLPIRQHYVRDGIDHGWGQLEGGVPDVRGRGRGSRRQVHGTLRESVRIFTWVLGRIWLNGHGGVWPNGGVALQNMNDQHANVHPHCCRFPGAEALLPHSGD